MGNEIIANAGQERQVASGHLLALDGVRGLAILMVIACHAFESDYESKGFIVRIIGESLHYGNTGVDLFFVLSGFLITGILFDSLRDEGYFQKFYARRALRIFPLYYGVLLVCFLLTYPLHLHWGSMGWLLLFYLQNLRPAEIAGFYPGPHLGLYHFWSLAVEEQFYLVWPAVVFWMRTRASLMRTMLIASAGSLALRILMVLAGCWPVTIHETTICRADSLLLGGALALLFRSSYWGIAKRWGPRIFVGTMALYFGMSGWLQAHPAMNPTVLLLWSAGLSYTVLAIAFSGLIAWSLDGASLCSRVFQRGWLRFLGKYSYGLYVLHVLVLSTLAVPLRYLLLGITHNKAVSVVVAGLVCVVLSIIAAYASYHLFEKHFLKLKHYFGYTRKSLNHGSPDDAFVGSAK